MSLDIQFLVQSISSMVVITSPMDPTKVLFFNQAISDPPRKRTWAAMRVAAYVGLILGGTAVAGRPALDVVGINLDAFSVVGGLIIALMGFEMLYGGGTSKAQGEDKRASGPEEGDALLMPLTLPLIAGPGAITTTISDDQPGGAGVQFGGGRIDRVAVVVPAAMGGKAVIVCGVRCAVCRGGYRLSAISHRLSTSCADRPVILAGVEAPTPNAESHRTALPPYRPTAP